MRLKALFLMVFFVFFVSCGDDSSPNSGDSSDSSGNGNSSGGSNNNNSSSSGNNNVKTKCEAIPDDLNRGLDNLGLENAIVIKYNSGSAPSIDNPYQSAVTVSANSENVVVTTAPGTITEYNLVVSGATSGGSLKVYGEYKIAIYLNGVSITNPSGPAINIQNNKKISLHLVGQTENYITDGPNYASSGTEDAKGTIFSEGQLVFSGSGYLEIKGKNRHALVSDGYLSIEGGCIAVVEAEGDGIHANDDVTIKSGIISIASKGDAIQSEGMAVVVTGGQITAKTTGIKSHGITSLFQTSIKDNANIDINVSGNGSKGIKSDKYTEIMGGTVNIVTSGGRDIDNTVAPPDTSNAIGIKSHTELWIEGGTLTIKSLGDKAKGISVDENIYMTAGSINIEADDDGIKVDGNLNVTGGSGSVTSKKKLAIDCKGATCNKGSLTTKDPGSF
ncbi:MAG: carbohydrate-binding domain-containing protein [Fibromonadales bacterium]|nr:carbohydrate-binding domain-containing protein [Fibromonadales bacterium]